MRKWIFAILFFFLATNGFAAGIGPGLIQVKEADGSPAGWVKSITVTNGGLSITGSDATISLSAGAGQPVTLDLGNNASIESADLGAIATTGDTNSIFTEPSADKLLIDVSKAWPVADSAKAGDSATAFFSAGTIEAAVLPVPSATTGGIAPTTSGHADGQVLTVQADGSAEWEASAAGVTTMAAMTDAGISEPADGHMLLWNTDSWDNKAMSGDVTIAATGATTIGANKVLESMLKAVDSATDEDVLTYESTTGDFEWHSRNEIASGVTVMTMADGALLDLSGITHSGAATEGLVLPNYANVVPGSDKKYLAADGSNLKLYNGGWVTIGATAAPTDASYLTLANDATLSAERVLTEGLAIDFTDAGANGALTIAFDPTELTGNRTWAAGGAASVTWTFDNSGSVDPTFTAGDGLFTFNQAVTVTGALTANGGIVMGTGDGLTVNSVNLLSGDELDGTKIKDADYGDVTINAAGAWAVEDDSHAHGSTTITLASTNLSDTAALGYLAGAQTWTANNVFGNADTDTLTLRSLLVGGNTRAVWIAGSAPTPTYATATNELYVAGDIETAGSVYAQSFVALGTGDSYIDLSSNAAYPVAAGNNSIAVVSNAWKLKENGTEKDLVTPDNSVTWTGASQSFSGVTNMVMPNASADAAGEMSINQTLHQLMLHAGGASADNALQTFDFDSCANGQVFKTNGSGVWACADDTTAGAPTLDTVGDPTADTTIAMDAGEEVNFDYTGDFTTGSQFRVRQVTGNPSGGVLFEVLGTDTHITLAKIGDGTNGVTVSAAGALTAAGTGTIVATGLSAATAPVPATAGGVALGSATAEWDHLYLHDGAIIYGQADQSATLTSSASLWTANNFAVTGYLAIGADPADAGSIRLPNAGYIYSEADAAGTDISVIGVDSAERVQIAASGSSGVTITPDTTITGDLTVTGADITLAAAGVKLTGSNGALTILGLGDGQDEDVKIDLNTTANTIIVSSPASSATAVSFSALNLVTTGSIQGGIKISSDADGMDAAAMTAAGMYGTLFIATGAGTWILPTAVAGMSACLMDSGTAHDLVLDATAGDTIRLKGTEGADGATITNATGSTTGDFVCVVAVDANKWSTMGMSGTWTVP